VILVSVAMIFGGLRLWVMAGWEKSQVVCLQEPVAKATERDWPAAIPRVTWRRRDRPVLKVLAMMVSTHFVGWLTLQLITSSLFSELLTSRSISILTALSILIMALPLLPFIPPLRPHLVSYPTPSYHPKRTEPQAPLHLILMAFNLCISSIVISITSVLNFSLAASLAVLLGLPLTLAKPMSPAGYLALLAITPMGLLWVAERLIGLDEVMRLFARTIWEWEVLGAWFLPFASVVYLPLVLQGMLVCVLPKE